MKEINLANCKALIYIPEGLVGKVPAVVFYPGMGETANDGSISLLYRFGPAYFIKKGWKPNFIVVAVHSKKDFPPSSEVDGVLTALLANHPVSKIYGTGLSAGGKTWLNYVKYCAAPQVAALVIMSAPGVGGATGPFKNIPVWFIHAYNDLVCKYAPIEAMYLDMKAKGYDVKLTRIKSTASRGHGNWNYYYTYKPDYRLDEIIYNWLLSK